MSSSSEDSDEEHFKKLTEAADTNFLTNKLLDRLDLNSTQKKDSYTTADSSKLESTKDPPKKSQRYIDLIDTSDGVLQVSKSMQNFFAKKLTKMIDEQIEFTPDIKTNKLSKKEIRKQKLNGVKLLKHFDVHISLDNEHLSISNEINDFNFSRKKPVIKRRVIESVNMSESEKIKAVAIDSNVILSGKEVENWSKRSKAQVFNYKSTKGSRNLTLIESNS